VKIRDRIVELRRVPAGEIKPNLAHPPGQREALKGRR
jgi:hypothetical protein